MFFKILFNFLQRCFIQIWVHAIDYISYFSSRLLHFSSLSVRAFKALVLSYDAMWRVVHIMTLSLNSFYTIVSVLLCSSHNPYYELHTRISIWGSVRSSVMISQSVSQSVSQPVSHWQKIFFDVFHVKSYWLYCGMTCATKYPVLKKLFHSCIVSE